MEPMGKRIERMEQIIISMWDRIEKLQAEQRTHYDNVRKLADIINVSNRQHCGNAKALADGLNVRQVGKGATVLNVNVQAHPRETEEKIERDAKGEMVKVVRRVTA